MENNPYLDDALEEQGNRETALRASMAVSVSANPDTAALAQKYASVTGLPSDTVERNLPKVANDVKFNSVDYGGIAKDNPYLADFLSDPDNARVAHDDIPALNRFSDGATLSNIRGPEPTLWNGVAGVAQSFRNTMNATSEGVIAAAADLFGFPALSDVAIKHAGERRFDEAVNSPQYPSFAGRTVYSTAKGIADTLPGLLGSIATANPIPFLATAATEAAGPEYTAVRERGGSPGQAAAASGAVGAIQTVAQAVPMGTLLKNFGQKPLRDFIVKFLVQDVGAQVAASLASQAVDTAIANPDKTWGDYWDEVKANTGETAAVAALTAGLFGGAHQLAYHASGAAARDGHSFTAQAQADAIQQDAQAARESKLRERAPDTFKEYVSTLGDNNIYVNPEAATSFYQDLPPKDRAALDTAMPELSQKITEAKATGADVDVSRADYLAHIAPLDPSDTLKDHVKLSASGLSVSEAQAMSHEAAPFDPTEGEGLESKLYEHLLQAGETPDTARQQSRKFRSVYETLAERVGNSEAMRDVLDKRFLENLSIEGPSPEGLKQKFDGIDLFIDEARSFFRQQAAAKAKQTNGPKDMLGQSAPAREASTPRPLVQYLIDRGGVSADSTAGKELKHIGNMPKRLFNPRGLKDVDNLVAREFNDHFSEMDVVAKEDGNGNVDPAWLYEQIRDESHGKHYKTGEQRQKDATQDQYHELRDFLGRHDLDLLNASNNHIKDLLKGQHEPLPEGKTFNQADEDRYRRDLKTVLDGGALPGRQQLRLGVTPEVLQALGFEPWPVRMPAEIALKATNQHFVFKDDLANLPHLLQDPLAVYTSGNKEKPAARVLAVETLDAAGDRVIAIIEPNAGKKANIVTSLYGKDNPEWFSLQERLGRLVYARDEKSLARLRTADHNYHGGKTIKPVDGRQGSSTNILTKEDVVKQSGKKTLFQQDEKAAEGLRSVLTEAAGNLKQAKGTGEQMLAALRNTAGVKEEEIAWTGLDEFLKGKKTVTKAEITDYLDRNQVKLEEVTLGKDLNDTREQAELRKLGYEWRDGRLYKIGEDTPPLSSELPDDVIKVLGTFNDAAGTKFEGYQLPGGENYREVLLTLPRPQEERIQELLQERGKIEEPYITKGLDLPESVKPRWKEINKELWAIRASHEAKNYPNYKGPHFDESNVLAHIRMNDRTDAAGRKVLFVEELQSDWHQAGRKQGYRDEKLVQARARQKELIRKAELTDEERKELADANNYIIDSGAVGKPAKGVPDAPFKKTWQEMAMRRVMQMAATEGYDRVAWTTGEQQAERYDLSKHLERVEYNDKTGHLLAYQVGRGGPDDVPRVDQDVKPEELADVIGKEAAEKIMQEKAGKDGYRALKNADLKVGGEGMKGFYDKILPDYARKFGKKYGAKVEDIPLKLGVDEKKAREAQIQRNGEDYSDAMTRRTVNVHSIDITSSMRDSARKGFELFQGGNKPRGSITFYPDGKTTINLFKNRNLSTLLHESGHFYWHVLNELAAHPEASGQIKEDAATIRDWVKYDPEKQTELSVEQEEKIARGFEAYLMEGKAPSIELRDTFRRFKAWLLRVYRKAENLDVTLNDQVRGVFDRLLATDSAIEKAKRNPVFTPDPAIMSVLNKAEAEKYIKQATRAAEEAKDRLFKTALLEESRKQTQWWKDNWAETEKANAELLAQNPLYNAIAGITKGEALDGRTFEKSLKLDRKAVEAMKGKEFVKYLPKASTVKGGMDPAIVADMFGFGSPDELLSKMAEAVPYAEKLRSMTEEDMRQRHGDMLNDGTIERQSLEAYHNEMHSDQLESEIDAIKGKVGKWIPGINARKEAIQAMARELVAAQPISRIQPYRYQRAEQRAANAASVATKIGNWEKAAEEKMKQRLNHYLYRSARDAQEDVDKQLQKWSRLTKGGDGSLAGRIAIDYVYAARYILSKHGIGKTDFDFEGWLTQLRHEDPDAATDFEDLISAKTRNSQDYREMPYSDFETFAEDLDQVIHMGKAEKVVTINGKEVYVEEAAQAIAGELHTNVGIRVQPLNPQRGKNPGLEMVSAILRAGTQINTYIEKADGGKPLGTVDKLLRADVRAAEANNALRQKEVAVAMTDILNKHYGKTKVGEYYVTRENLISQRGAVYIAQLNRSLTREEILAFAFNKRNDDNWTKFLEGRGFSEEDGAAVLRQLRPQDVAFANDVGQLIENHWPEIAALEKRTKGYIPQKVYGEDSEIINKDGEVLKLHGGYFPLKFDGDLSIRAGENEMDAEFRALRQGRFAAAATRRGFTKERVANVRQPVRLDALNVIGQHLREVVTDLTMREAIQNTNKLLKTRTVREAFQETYGADIYRDFDIWIKDTAVGQLRAAKGIGNVWRAFRHGATISAQAWKVSTALVQLAGASQSAVELRPKWFLKGLQRYAQLNTDASEFIRDRSPALRAREMTINRDVADSLRKLQQSAVLSDIQATFFIPMLKVQGVVDQMTWLGAFEKAVAPKEEGGEAMSEADAIRYSDLAVENAQGSGNFSSLSPFLRGTIDQNTRLSEAVKAWTLFMSYFNTKFNVARRRTNMTDFKSPGSVLSLAADYVTLFWVEAVVSDLILGRGPPQDDDKSSTFLWNIKEALTTFMAGVPLLRDIATAWAGIGGGPAPEKGVSNLVAAGKNIAQVGKAGAEKVFTGQTDEELNWYKISRSLLDAGLYFSPVKYPAGQIDTVIRAMEKKSQGETVTPMDYVATRYNKK